MINPTGKLHLETEQMLPELAWYCVQSRRRQEQIAVTQLRGLDGVTVFYPRIRFKKSSRRGVVWVTDAMFPGYLFARCALSKMHRQIRYAHGVSGIVRFGDRYPTIEEEVLAQLRNRTGSAEVTELNYELSEGVQVKITGGAFAGLEAVVIKVLPAKQRVKVLMQFLGTKVEAEVGDSNVLPQAVNPLSAKVFD
jgi:transcriptional antiterminator RfaH